MRRNHFCELSFIARRPKSLRERGTQRGILIFFCGLLFMAGTSQKPTPTWRAKKCEAKTTRKPWSILTFFLIHLHSQNLPRKPYGVSSFFCESTFPRGTSPENSVAFQVFFLSRPSHPQLPRKPCGVSSFFLWVDLPTHNLPRKPCGMSSAFASWPLQQEPSQKTMWHVNFFCESTSATRTFPENHAAFQFFFVSRPSHPEPSQKTMWRFKYFLWVHLRTPEPSQRTMWHFKFSVWVDLSPRTFPENHMAFHGFLANRPSRQEPSHMAFQFCWVNLHNKNLPRKPCGVSIFLSRPSHPEAAKTLTHVGFQVFFVSRPSHPEAAKTLTHVGFQVFFVSRPSHPEAAKTLTHVGFQLFFVNRPSHSEAAKTWTHVAFQVFFLEWCLHAKPSGTSRRMARGRWGAGARRGSQRTQFKTPPMHWLKKGWPGRWRHSTTLCSPMQEIHFDLNSLASITCLFSSCPPYTTARTANIGPRLGQQRLT